jgi:hypothetical protein
MARVWAVRQKKPGAATVATCRCCGCRGPEQHLHATPWPRPKIGEADTDHQPVQRTPHARGAHISMARSTCRGMTNWPCSSSHLRYRGVRCNGLRETGRMPWAAPRSHRRQSDRAVDRRALSTAAGHPCRTPDSAEGPLGHSPPAGRCMPGRTRPASAPPSSRCRRCSVISWTSIRDCNGRAGAALRATGSLAT